MNIESYYEKMFYMYSDICTARDVSEMLHLNKKRCYNLLQSGEIPCLIIGRSIRIPKIYIYEYIEKQKKKSNIDVENLFSLLFQNYPDVVTVKQLSEMFLINTKAAYDLLHDKSIKFLTIGNSFRIPKVFIFDFIKENLQKSPLRFDR